MIPSFIHPQIKKGKTTPQPLPQSAAKDDDGPSGSNTSDASSTTTKDSTSKGQQNISMAFLGASKYKSDAKEQRTKVDAVARWIGRTGLPVTTIEDEDFLEMMEIVDKRLTVPKKTKISNMIEAEYASEKQKFKQRLAAVRKVTIGLDMWSKKGLTASFLAISACYFCVERNEPEHILLTLEQIAHLRVYI